MAELFINPLVPLPITVSTIRMTTDPVAGRVLTCDDEGNGFWETTGPPGPASDLIDPITIFEGTANSVLTTGAGADPNIVYKTLTSGQVLIGSTGVAPVAATLTPGSNMNVVGGAGTITLSVDPSPSFSHIDASSITSTGVVVGGAFNTPGSISATGTIAGSTLTAGTAVNTNTLNVSVNANVTGTVLAGVLNGGSANISSTIIAHTVAADTGNIDHLNTTDFKLTTAPTNGFILQSNSSGKGTWVAPSSAVTVTAGPSNNLTVTHPSSTVTQIDTVAGPAFTSLSTSGLATFGLMTSPSITGTTSITTPILRLNSSPNNLQITCPSLGQATTLQIEDMKNVNAAFVTSTRNTVTQVGTITSDVTINGPTGIITTITGGIIRDDTNTIFQVFNSYVTASSVVILTCTQPGFNPTGGGYIYSVSSVTSGSFRINLQAVNIAALHTFASTWKFSFLIA